MITEYLKLSFAITFISWIVGMIFSGIFHKTEFFKSLSNFNFLRSKTWNKRIGIGIFKWIVKNTPFKFFNDKIKMTNKVEITHLNQLRKEMTIAEINHLVGFIFVTAFALVSLAKGDFLFALFYMIANTLLNLYPSLLQQENKRRIDRMIKIYSRI